MSDSDKLVEQLLAKVAAKKAEIKKLERPVYKTNCTFILNPFDSNSKRVNFNVADLDSLINVLATLMIYRDSFEKAGKELGLKGNFQWGGWSYEDWLADIKTSVDRFSVAKKKAELDTLEKKLNTLISPEQRRQMDLAEIAKSLESDE